MIKKFLKTTGFKFETDTETAFAKALTQSEKDDFKDEVNSLVAQIQSKIGAAKDAELDSKRAEIEGLLEDEIVKRYFYRDGLYQYQIANNKEIAEALSVLRNASRYEKILK